MGAERSGSSTIARFLREELGYAGESEGHVFSLLHSLLIQVHSHFVANGFSLGDSAVEAANKGFDTTTAELISKSSFETALCSSWRELVRFQHAGLWFDKTPGPFMIRCAPVLRKMYPSARFIVLIRDPVSSVESSMRKFGTSFDEACDRWKECIEAWLQTKGLLPQNCFIELKTHELSSKTEDCLERIANLLIGHPLSVPVAEVRQKRLVLIERTSTSDPRRTKSTDATGWALEQKRVFREKCSGLATIFGFSQEEDTQVGDSATIHFPPPHGQRNVEIAHGDKGGVWPQLHDGKVCIFLHPTIGEGTTSITYSEVEFPLPGELSVTAYVLPEASAPVNFEMQVVGDGAALESQSCVCGPGEQKEMLLRISRAIKHARVKISTRSASESGSKLWALISCPVFQAGSPGSMSNV